MARVRPLMVIPAAALTLLVFSFSKATAAEPAAPAPAPNIDDTAVVLPPFAAVGDALRTHPWVGRAIQQNVLNDLSRIAVLRPVVPDRPVDAIDADSARKVATDNAARYILYGSFQLIGNDLRITGQIFDARAGQHVGAVKATGSARDLFLLEDTIAEQTRRILMAELRLTRKAVAQVPPAMPAPPAAPNPALPNPNAGPPRAQPGPAPQAAPPAAGPFPWDLDARADADRRERLTNLLDDEYDASLTRYRNAPYYGGYGSYGYGWRPWYRGYRYGYGGFGYGGVTFFPGGVARGHLAFFPGGVINTGW